MSQVDFEDGVMAVVRIWLNHRRMPSEEKPLVSSGDRSPDCLN
jgi:hypothetical protein